MENLYRTLRFAQQEIPYLNANLITPSHAQKMVKLVNKGVND